MMISKFLDPRSPQKVLLFNTAGVLYLVLVDEDRLSVDDGDGGHLTPDSSLQPPASQQHGHPLHLQLPAPVLGTVPDH